MAVLTERSHIATVHSYYSSDFQLQDTGEFPSGIMTQPLQATQVVQSSTSPPTHNISNVDTVQRTGTGHSRNMERANDGTNILVKLAEYA